MDSEGPADGNAKPALEPRDDVFELAIAAAEGPVRRDAESPLSNAGKDEPTADTRAGPTLKERWIIHEMEELIELYSGTRVGRANIHKSIITDGLY